MQGNPLGAQLTFPEGGDRPHPPLTWVTWPVAAGLVASSLALSFCQPIVHTAARANYSKRGLFTSPGFIPFIQWYPPWLINTFCSGKIYSCTSQCASQCLAGGLLPPCFSHYMESFHSDAFIPAGIFLQNFQYSAPIRSLNSS